MQDALNTLPDDTGRYLFYHEVIKCDDGRQPDVVLLLNWIPHSLKIKQKMQFTQFADSVEDCLVVKKYKYIANERKELDSQDLYTRMKKTVN